jgi:hypothetical protein
MPSRHVRIIRVGRGVVVAQGLDDLGEHVMLPADQDVPAAAALGVRGDEIRHAVLVVAVARCVRGQAQVGGEGLDGLEGARARAI